jgi:aldehyde dehydrogenase (NAD+)
METAIAPEKVDIEKINKIYKEQRNHKPAMVRLTAKERIARIKKIKQAMFDYREQIEDAMYRDFKKHPTEVDVTELYAVINDANHTIKHLKRWMGSHKVSTPLNMLGTSGKVIYEPKGNTLIISPWNFPINLSFGPMISAIAAGNTVILKPSELTPHSSGIMAQIIGDLFPENEVAVITGGVETSTELLSLKFDHIFFTGSPGVGKIVMKAAAKHLTSVTLELGGKSPTIVDRTANIKRSAKRIAWGKWANNGQTCIAPDYIYVHRSKSDELVAELEKNIKTFYGDDASESDSYARIINDGHTERINGLLMDVESDSANGKIVFGGITGIKERYISPTIVVNPSIDSRLMQEEIFGPILPILLYDNIDEVINFINAREKPLALYIYSNKNSNINKIVNLTSSGGVLINDSLIHFFHNEMPFGGANNSGIGKSHGFYGFQAFSNTKGVLRQYLPFSAIQLLYPPYTPTVKKWVDIFMKYF